MACMAWSEFDVFQKDKKSGSSNKKKKTRLQEEHGIGESDSERRRSDLIAQLKAYAIPMAYAVPLPISEAKKRDLTGLCRKGIIPQELHPWYASLPTSNDVQDRSLEPDVHDESEESD